MTFSVVASDGQGLVGVAVSSCVVAVGRAVPWVRAGVGAVATQSFTRRAYGPELLDALAGGAGPGAALAAATDADGERSIRQVAVVSASGAAAAYTGAGCIAVAGDEQGDGFSVQGNMLAASGVVPAMSAAYTGTGGSGGFAERLVAALVAADGAGGDFRGRQSAAVMVADANAPGDAHAQVVVDLRVDDHPDPMAELGRLLDLQRRHEALDPARIGTGDAAAAAYHATADVSPEPQATMYRALAYEQAGDLDRARAEAARLRAEPSWPAFLERLDGSPRFPASRVLRGL